MRPQKTTLQSARPTPVLRPEWRTESFYPTLLEKAKKLSVGFSACLQLQRELGLRTREVCNCTDQFSAWAKRMAVNCATSPGYTYPLRVMYDIGGPRRVSRDVPACNKANTLNALTLARQHTRSHGGRLLPGIGDESDSSVYARLCADLGISAEEMQHGLRSLYARDRFLSSMLPYAEKPLDTDLVIDFATQVALWLGYPERHTPWVWEKFLNPLLDGSVPAFPARIRLPLSPYQ